MMNANTCIGTLDFDLSSTVAPGATPLTAGTEFLLFYRQVMPVTILLTVLLFHVCV